MWLESRFHFWKARNTPLCEPLLSSQKALNFGEASDGIFGFQSREASARFQEFAVFDGLGKFADIKEKETRVKDR